MGTLRRIEDKLDRLLSGMEELRARLDELADELAEHPEEDMLQAGINAIFGWQGPGRGNKGGDGK